MFLTEEDVFQGTGLGASASHSAWSMQDQLAEAWALFIETTEGGELSLS